MREREREGKGVEEKGRWSVGCEGVGVGRGSFTYLPKGRRVGP